MASERSKRRDFLSLSFIAKSISTKLLINNNNNNNNNNTKIAIAKVWSMRKVVIPVVLRALGAVLVNFKECMKRIGVNVKLEVIQKTALLGTAKILRKVLSL